MQRSFYIQSARLEWMLEYAPAAIWLEREVLQAAIEVVMGTFVLLYPTEDIYLQSPGELSDECGIILPQISAALDELRADRDLMLMAVRHDGLALRCVAAALQDDQDVVLAAVSENGDALEFASEALRDDAAIVSAAVEAPIRQESWVPVQVLAAVQAFGAPEKYRWAGVRRGPIRFASDRLRGEKDLVLAAVKREGQMLRYASVAMQDDYDVVLGEPPRGPHCSSATRIASSRPRPPARR